MSVPWPTTLPEPLLEHELDNQTRGLITEMDSRRVRRRRMFSEPLKLYSFRWSFTADQFEAFETFYVTSLENGSLEFSITETEAGPHAVCPVTIVTTYAFMEPWNFNRTDNSHVVTGLVQRTDRVVTPTPAPAVPDNLELTNPSSGVARFAFDVPEDAWTIEVQRKIEGDSNDWEDLETVDVTASGPISYFVDDTPEPEISYCYRARSVSPCGNSDWTSELCIVLPLEVPPAAPELTLTVDFPDVELEWTTIPNTDEYEIEQSANDSGVWVPVDTTTTPDTDYTDSPATDTDWSYRVRAVNAYGNSDWSNIEVAELSTIVNLDAFEITGLDDGDSISSWADEGPRGTLVAQSTEIYRPKYDEAFGTPGHPAVFFSRGLNYDQEIPTEIVDTVEHLAFSNLSDDLDNGMTIFIVAGAFASNTNRPWLSLDSGGNNRILVKTDGVGDGSIEVWESGTPTAVETLDDLGGSPGPFLYTIRITASEITYWVNASITNTGVIDSALPDVVRSASRLGAGSNINDTTVGYVHMQEVLIKNRAMSNPEIVTRQYELFSKWGITL